jgi:hypothetical protein
MDKASYAGLAEIIRLLLVAVLFFSNGRDWFGLAVHSSIAPSLVLCFQMVSLFISLYFHFSGQKEISPISPQESRMSE